MHIEEIIAKIIPADAECVALAQKRFDELIKPIGSLGQLEKITARYAGIIRKHVKHEIKSPKRALFVWSDLEHAAQAEKILELAMPVNMLAASSGAKTVALVVTSDNEEDALEEGATLVQELVSDNVLELLGFGCLASVENSLVRSAMVGGILMAASMGVGVVLDGIATCTAAKKAAELAPSVIDYCFAGHVSAESGAEELLGELGLTAPLRLDIPEGAGEGAAVCFLLFDAGIASYKEMETFEEAGVHSEMKEFSMAEEAKKKKQQG